MNSAGLLLIAFYLAWWLGAWVLLASSRAFLAGSLKNPAQAKWPRYYRAAYYIHYYLFALLCVFLWLSDRIGLTQISAALGTGSPAFWRGVWVLLAPSVISIEAYSWLAHKQFASLGGPPINLRHYLRTRAAGVVPSCWMGATMIVMLCHIRPGEEAIFAWLAGLAVIILIYSFRYRGSRVEFSAPIVMDDSPLKHEIFAIANNAGFFPKEIFIQTMRRKDKDIAPSPAELAQHAKNWHYRFNPHSPYIPIEFIQALSPNALTAAVAIRYARFPGMRLRKRFSRLLRKLGELGTMTKAITALFLFLLFLIPFAFFAAWGVSFFMGASEGSYPHRANDTWGDFGGVVERRLPGWILERGASALERRRSKKRSRPRRTSGPHGGIHLYDSAPERPFNRCRGVFRRPQSQAFSAAI